MPPGWPSTMLLTKRNAVNRNAGKSDRHPLNIFWYDGDSWDWWAKWHDQALNGNYVLTRDIMGDEYDAWNIGYNEIFSPWSNPSTYSGGTTNISVQLYSQDGNNITIKVFSTEASGLALPPSKPQNLRLTSGTGNHPVLTWDANIDPDLSSYRVYKKLTLTGGGTSTTYISTTSTTYTDLSFTITNPHFGTDQAEYWIVAVDNTNKLSVDSDHRSTSGQSAIQWKFAENKNTDPVTAYELHHNYPNPFNPTTTIQYDIKEKGVVLLKIYDILGKEVAELVNEVKEEGRYIAEFNASDLPSGVYIYSLRVNNFISNQKMLLLK